MVVKSRKQSGVEYVAAAETPDNEQLATEQRAIIRNKGKKYGGVTIRVTENQHNFLNACAQTAGMSQQALLASLIWIPLEEKYGNDIPLP